MIKRYLSKSKLLSFLQCPRRLYLEVTHPGLATVSDGAAAIMESGNTVGEIARSLHADGVLIESQGNLSEAIRQSAQHLAAKVRAPLFEATFQHDGTLVRTDLLLPAKNAWHLVEVKSSTRVKDYHLADAAIQRFVLEKAGVAVDGVSIQVIDNSFVYPGKGRYHEVKPNGKVNSLFAQIGRAHV